MKSILIVIYAHYVKLIIEGKKTVEVRKNKNLANAIKKLIAEQGGCWIYIYVAKSTPELYVTNDGFVLTDFELGEHYKFKCLLNGKVVARFWCDKVEEIYKYEHYEPELDIGIGTLPEFTEIDYCGNEEEWENHEWLYEKSCLSFDELDEYLQGKNGYAIHISKLEVFDRPRDLWEFVLYDKNHLSIGNCIIGFGNGSCKRLTNAPQNFCYIESEK